MGNNRESIEPLEIVSQTLFIPVFFLLTGFLVNLDVFYKTLASHTVLVISLVGCLVAAKFLAAQVHLWLFRTPHGEILQIWSLSLSQVAATLAAAIVAFSTVNFANERLLRNAILVLVIVTSVLAPLLNKRYGAQVV